MIVRRNRPPSAPKLPRVIVRRGKQAVGQRAPRMIVRRSRGGVEPPRDRRPRGPRFPRPGRRWFWAAGAFGGVLALIGAGFWVWSSPFFKVNNIEVVGNELVGTDTIVERAGLLGQSMFTADLAIAQKEVFQQPLIHTVTIERRWPETVRIVVEERRAWGTWEQGGVRYTIDREGVVLGTVPPAEGSPLVRSSAAGSKRQGDRVDYQAVDAASEIYDRLPRQLGATVTEVAYLAGKGVQVTISSGETALLGDSSSIAYKLAVWAALRREAQVRGINYVSIDLRYGNRPVLQ